MDDVVEQSEQVEPKEQAEQYRPPEQKVEHQGAGVIVLQWLSYAFWGWLIIGCIWLLAVVLMSFISGDASSSATDMLPYAIAAVVVLLPVAFVLDVFYRRHEPVKKVGVSAVIMVIHVVIFALCGIGVLISAIFVSLNAVISGRFSDGQMVAMLTLVGATLLYAAAFLRTLRPAKLTRLPAIYGFSMFGIAVILLILGVVGPLASSIRARDDRRIESYLGDVNWGIQGYVSNNNKAPASLDDVEFSEVGAQELVDDGLVRYKNKGTSTGEYNRVEYNYQLCVTYRVEKKREYSGDYSNRADSDESKLYAINYAHPKGETCYTLQQITYPPTYDDTGVSIFSEGLEAN